MNARPPGRPWRRLGLAALTLTAPAISVTLILLLARGGPRALGLEITIIASAGCAVIALLPRRPIRTQRRARRGEPDGIWRPQDLQQLERLVGFAPTNAGDVHFRLRPLLREIALARLQRHRVDLDRDQRASRELLGDRAWDVVRPDRPRPERGDPGVATSELAEIVDRLEHL
jgi:hypothetical protein